MAHEFYKYTWEITFNIPNRKISFLPYSLISFTKNCDYFNNSIPSYSLSVKMQEQVFDVLKKYDKELLVNIKQKMIYGNDENNYNKEKIIFEDVFIPFYDKNTIPSYTKADKQVDSSVDNMSVKYKFDDMPGMYKPYEMNFVLLSKRDLTVRKFIHNYVLGSDKSPVDPASAVAFVISQNDYVDKFLMDSPDNDTTYPDLIIKPADIVNAIRQIQINYGIYMKDLTVFYDSGFMYILNKYATDHAYQDDENITVMLRLDERIDKISPEQSVIINDKKQTILYERGTKIVKQDQESIMGELVGDKFVYSNFSSVINAGFGNKGKTTYTSPLHDIERDIPSHKDTGTKIIMDYDMLNNPFNMSSYMAKTSLGVPIAFTLSRVNCEHFAPNKKFVLIFDTPESNKMYSGTYNIGAASFSYVNTGDPKRRFETFCHTTISLVNKTDGLDKDYEIK